MSPAKPPRIGYVVKRYPRYSETFIVNEILAHEAAGWDLEIFALRPPVDTHFQDALARVRAPVTYLPGSGLKATDFWQSLEAASAELPGLWAKLEAARGEAPRDVHAAVHLARAARLRGLTHLHAHFASSATSVARMAARFADLPYSFTAHAKDIFHESVDPADFRRKLREAAAVVTVSDFNLAFLRERYGVDARRVARIYNGLDLDRFPFSAPGERPPEILAVGRLVEKKGFSDLLEACAHLRDRGVSFSCRIIGGGDLEAALRARIERLDLGAHVCLSGPRPQREVIERLRRAAVFAAPCVVGSDGNRDGLPTVLLEAMALGTPCVSTDVTGIPEALRDGETGLQVPRRAPAALADALARLLSDAELRVRLATAARRLIETSFDVHRNAARLRNLFVRRSAPDDALPFHRLAEAS